MKKLGQRSYNARFSDGETPQKISARATHQDTKARSIAQPKAEPTTQTSPQISDTGDENQVCNLAFRIDRIKVTWVNYEKILVKHHTMHDLLKEKSYRMVGRHGPLYSGCLPLLPSPKRASKTMPLRRDDVNAPKIMINCT
jgi:hypothetical protein